jgi:Cu(I)/Ag(I) efflux system membrane fusion protein
MRRLAIGMAVLAALAVGFATGYRYALPRAGQGPEKAAQEAGPQSPGARGEASSDKTVLYWYDPMYPQHKFDKPGKSPFMDMQLVPRYSGEEADSGTVAISPRLMQSLGVRTAEAQSGALESRWEAVGAVAYNERGVVQLQARAAGFVEKLHARAPLDPVRKGAPLVTVLYPEWAGAQEEYLLLLKSSSIDVRGLAQAGRQRLLLLGMSEEQIEAVERAGEVRARATLRAPIAGVIAELGVREGMTVAAGTPLFKLVDLSTVWVNAEVPEAQAGRLLPGSAVDVRVAAYPESVFKGTVGALLPEVAAATRTVRARIELPNPGSRLKPGMYATLSFAGHPGARAVLAPSEAVIRTGTRDVVIVALGEGRFRAAEVKVGEESGGQSEILEGLRAGERVVLSGQFLIDSEASLASSVTRLQDSQGSVPAQGASGAAATHAGTGKVRALDPAAGRVELDHEPIPGMQWPRMTMGFVVEDKAQLARIRNGDSVEFELRAEPDADGNYVLSRIGAKP